jgi:hypothetical protein
MPAEKFEQWMRARRTASGRIAIAQTADAETARIGASTRFGLSVKRILKCRSGQTVGTQVRKILGSPRRAPSTLVGPSKNSVLETLHESYPDCPAGRGFRIHHGRSSSQRHKPADAGKAHAATHRPLSLRTAERLKAAVAPADAAKPATPAAKADAKKLAKKHKKPVGAQGG